MSSPTSQVELVVLDQISQTPLSFAQALTEYEQLHLASRNFAARTRREYLGDLRTFARFLAESSEVSSPLQVSKQHLHAYLAHLDGKGYSGAARRCVRYS